MFDNDKILIKIWGKVGEKFSNRDIMFRFLQFCATYIYIYMYIVGSWNNFDEF